MRLAPVVLAVGLLPAGAYASPQPPQFSADECAVWQREQSFAQSVADHDAVAFAEHVSENAAFGASTPAPTRGRAAIAKDWSGVVEGKQMALRWYPTRVTIAGAPDVAWSSGPALFESLDPKAKHRYMMSRFHSVWRKEADGTWRVLFDDGTQPRPATDAEVEAFHRGRAACTPTQGG